MNFVREIMSGVGWGWHKMAARFTVRHKINQGHRLSSTTPGWPREDRPVR